MICTEVQIIFLKETTLMSANKDKAQSAEKVMTKYDLKMQKRAEDKRKEEKSLMIWKIVGVVVLAAVIGFIASFPVRRLIAVNRTVVTVDGRKIGQVEFDYMYNTVKTNYMQNYGSYLSYYGLSETTDPSTVMYNDKLSFKEYFEQLAVDQFKENAALQKEANAAGFKYDAGKDWTEFLENAGKSAKASDMNLADYLKNRFGTYATKSNLKPLVERSVTLSEYYQRVYDSKLPSDSEIDAYYDENKSTYDSVDYFISTVNAVMPTEPTELADEGAAVAEDGSYTPSDAEKNAAMEAARADADKAVKDIMTEGTAHTGELSSSVNFYVRDWLFDEARVEGDTTVIENTVSNCYYAVGFSSRYRVEAPTADIRAIVTDTDNGAEIMSEWNATDKTEDSFIELVKRYSIDSTEGGLYENQNPDTYDGELKEWLFSGDRKEGDVANFFVQGTYTYVVYFKGEAEPVWKLSIRDAIMNTRMNEYMDTISEGIEADGDLKYMVVEKEEAAAKEAEDASGDPAESTDNASEGTDDSSEDTAE